MKKIWRLCGVVLICAQALLPLGQVVAHGEEALGADKGLQEQVARANEEFTSVETEDYIDSADYKAFGFDTEGNAPKTFDANDGDNPLLGVTQTYFDELYIGYVNKKGKNKGLFSVKENLNTEAEISDTGLDEYPKLIVPDNETVELDEDAEIQRNDVVTSKSDLKRIGDTPMLHEGDPELISYKAQNVISFVGDQRTRISETISELKGDSAKQIQSMEEQLAINKGFSAIEEVKIDDNDYSTKEVGQVSRLNSDDLYFNDQAQYIFETALYYGDYNGGLTTEEAQAKRTKTAASGIRLTAYQLDKEKQQYVPVSQPYTKQLDSSRNTAGKEYLKKLEAKNAMALTALAKGDYDKDGKEEVAVYFPDAGTKGPYIAFFEIRNGQLKEKIWPNTNKTRLIKLEDMDPKFGMKVRKDGVVSESGSWEREYMPSVHLHTTKVAGKDQLVINATLPRVKSDSYKNKSHKSLMTIYDYKPENNDAMAPICGTFELTSPGKEKKDDVRMQYAAATDGDLDGDGDQELVVVGYKETDFEGDKFKYGKIHDTELYLQVFEQNDPKQEETEAEKKDGINRSITFHAFDKGFNKIEINNLEDDRNLMPPVALDMGVMNYNPELTTPVPEYLFANGALARHDPEKYPENNEDELTDYKLENLDKMDTNRYEGDAELTYHSAYFAKLSEDSLEEKIMVVHSNADTERDNITIHPSIIGVNEKDKITYDCIQDDYLNNKDEENDGTFLTFRPLNVDRDTTFYKYIGKEAGWSKPTVMSIIPAAPMWKEFEYGDTSIDHPSISYTVSNGTGSEIGGTVSVGAGINYQGLIYVAEGAATFARTWAQGTSTTISSTMTPLGSTDQVILFATPKTVYKYKRYMPRKIITKEFLKSTTNADKSGSGEYSVSDELELKEGDVIKNFISEVTSEVTGTPLLTTQPVWEFNKNVQNANRNLADKKKIQLIDMEAITAHGKVENKDQSNQFGNPFSFPEKVSEYANKEGENIFDTVSYKVNKDISLNGSLDAAASLDKNNKSSVGFSLSFAVGIHARAIGRDVAVKAQASGGANWSTMETHGEAYKFSIPCLKHQGAPNTDIQQSNYSFKAGPALFRTTAYKNNDVKDMDQEIKKEMEAMELNPESVTRPYVLTYEIGAPIAGSVADHSVPPALPTNLRIYDRKYVPSGTEQKSKTRVLATLAWDLPTDETRQPTHYEIYNRLKGGADDDWNPLTTDGTDVLKVPGNQNYVVVELEDTDRSKEYKVVSVNQINSDVRLESVASQTITVNGLTDSDPVFLSQPQPYWEQEPTTNPIFSAMVQSSDEPNRLYYQWQKMTDDGKWISLDNTEGIASKEGNLISLELVKKPSEITRYRLKLNQNDCYFNYSDIANYYPLASQQVNVAVDVLSTDTIHVTPTSEEDKSGYLASEVVTDQDCEKTVTVQGVVTDKENVRVTEGTVILRVNGEIQDKVTLKDTDELAEQGVATFSLPYQKEEQEISVEYIGMGNEPVTGYYPAFTLKGENVVGSASAQQILYQLVSPKVSDPLQLLSPFDGERQLPVIERLGQIFKGWCINGVEHEPLQQVSYEKLLELMPQLQNRTVGEAQKLELLPIFEDKQYQVAYHNLDGSEGFIGKELLQGKEGIRVSQTARLGYEFGGWYHDEGLTIPATEITLEPTKDLQYFAKWEEKTYTIRFKDEHFEEIREPLTYTASEVYNGGVSLGGTYHKDNSFTEAVDTLTPDYYGNLVVLAHSGETDPDVDPTEPEPDPTVTSFTVAASSEGGGTITPNGQITLAAGESQVFTMKPEAGNRLAKLELDGKAVAVADNQYTLENIQGNHKLVAYFEKEATETTTSTNEANVTPETSKPKGNLPKTGEIRSHWQVILGALLIVLGVTLVKVRRKD
ncbi:LPXTG cell wall anchor domain-containing protein [Enterococcus sp. 2201sp1_2201st1_B8_2201SCRN_220225]|uniref:LPXTG cell wall anchor domain-containing protein n=1 Tax=unclassified Enterococcus TaxID=2608891 RepID=UPI0034A4FF3B